MKRKIIRIFLFLFFLEIFLRIGGLVALCIQDYQNHFDSKAKQSYRILCVGESMTMVGGDSSYPRLLEGVLNQKNLLRKFQVIDKGISGASSDVIFNAMENFIKEYKPDMVITMMGLNDSSGDPFSVQMQGGSHHSIHFIEDLRVYKLFKGILKDLKENFAQFFHYSVHKEGPVHQTREATIYDEHEDFTQGPSDDNTAKAMKVGLICLLKQDYVDAERVFRLLIASPYAKIYNSKTTFYHYLALILTQESKFKDLMATMDHVPYWNWYDIPVISFCGNPANAAYEIDSFKNMQEEFPSIPFYSEMISQCYEKSGDASRAQEWKARADQLKESRIFTRTKVNYLKLLNLLKKNNITPVLMQYPLENVEILKSTVQSAGDDQRIVFVDNERIFQEAVQAQGYDAVFSDYLGGDFGHPTLKGRRILAQHIAQTLITEMNWK